MPIIYDTFVLCYVTSTSLPAKLQIEGRNLTWYTTAPPSGHKKPTCSPLVWDFKVYKIWAQIWASLCFFFKLIRYIKSRRGMYLLHTSKHANGCLRFIRDSACPEAWHQSGSRAKHRGATADQRHALANKSGTCSCCFYAVVQKIWQNSNTYIWDQFLFFYYNS